MIRLLIGVPLVLVLLAAGGIYAAYGEVDPCRVLAVEKARRADAMNKLGMGGIVQWWERIETSQMSTGQCARGLVDSWEDRLAHRGGG